MQQFTEMNINHINHIFEKHGAFIRLPAFMTFQFKISKLMDFQKYLYFKVYSYNSNIIDLALSPLGVIFDLIPSSLTCLSASRYCDPYAP